MDSVRFGRVLGIGARLAAKTVKSAVDAAAAPSPTAGGDAAAAKPSGAPAKIVERPGARVMAADATSVTKRVVQTKTQVKQSPRGLKQGGKRFGEAMWGPFARLGGVLWLEMTGVFFGLIALSVALGAWKMRAGLHAAPGMNEEHVRFMVAVGVAVLFGYFCVSSFVRAGRRGRRR